MPSLRNVVSSPFRRGVVLLALVTLLWRGWTVSRWSWQNDDWLLIEGSVSMPFWSYLFQEHHGHLLPGGFLVTDLMTRSAPLDFRVVVSLVALASAANVLIWGRAFERVTRGRTIALLPLSILVLSPVLVEPMQWWASSALALPLQMSLGGMVIAACRWTESPRVRELVWLGAAFLAGCFFWHKSLLLTMPISFVLLALASGSLRDRLRSIHAPLAVLLAISIPYVILFRYLTARNTASYDVRPTLEGHSFSDSLRQYAHGFGDMFLPSLLGGPWGSMQVDSDPWNSPAPVVTTAVLVACVAALVWLALRHRQVLWLLLLPLFYTVLSLGVVLFSSRAMDQWDVMTIERYYVDAVVVAMLSGALMIRDARLPQPSNQSSTARRRWTQGLALALVATSLVVSNVLAADRIGTHAGRSWVDTLRSNVTSQSEGRSSDAPLVIWDAYSPDAVLQPAWWNDAALLSQMLLPFGDKVAFAVPAEQVHQVDANGNLVPISISRLSRSIDGPVDDCGYYVEPGMSVTVDMSTDLYHWGWGLQLDGFSSTGGDLVVDVGSTQIPMTLPPGLQTRLVQMDGAIDDEITVSVPQGSEGSFCITDIHVGSPEPTA